MVELVLPNMTIYDVDWRYDWLSITLRSLEAGFELLEKRALENEWFDGLFQLEHTEAILGIAFVSAQTYILGVTQDINKIRAINGSSAKRKNDYYNDDLQPLQNRVSRVTLINAITNYHKHHDEWESWPTNVTTEALVKIGIGEKTDFPCYEAVRSIWNFEKGEHLRNLLSITSEWREHISIKYK